MLNRLKRAVFGLCKGVGAFELAANTAWRHERLLILGYHGISQQDEHHWDPSLYMPPEQFRARLRLLLNRGYRVLSLDEGLQRLYAKRLPPRSVAITFDDGYVDFYRQAYPILSELGVPSTVYLTTYHCGDDRPVFDVMVSYVLWKGRGQVLSAEPFVEGKGTLDLRTEEGRHAAHLAIRRSARERGLSAAVKDTLARALAERLGVDYDALVAARLLHLMRPDEVRSLSPALVDVQLHTHRHRTPRDREHFCAEISDNRARIEAVAPWVRETSHFCYPSGDYDPLFLPWLRALGVRSATTCEPGFASPATEPLLLPRLMDSSTLPAVVFEAWASGLGSWLPRRRSRRAPVDDLSTRLVPASQ